MCDSSRVSTTEPQCHSLCVLCVHAPDNKIGDAGAAALVEGLKEMTNLKELNLYCEYGMVGIICQVAVMSWIKQGAGWCAHGETGRGPRAIMMWLWSRRV